jgi:hypothetical protein
MKYTATLELEAKNALYGVQPIKPTAVALYTKHFNISFILT